NAGTGNDVGIELLRNDIDWCFIADTVNQCNVIEALEQFPSDDPLLLAIVTQTAEGARQAADALSGEVHATLSGVLLDDSRYLRDSIFARLQQAFYAGGSSSQIALATGGPTTIAGGEDPFTAGRMALGASTNDDASAPAFRSGLAFWTQAYGAWGDFKGNGNAASADRTLGGFVSGMDANIGGSWRAGVATGYAQSNTGVDARLSSADVDGYHLAAYAGGRIGDFALRGGGAWTWSGIDTNRTVVFPGFFEREEASYDGDTGQLFAEAALPLTASAAALEPFGRLAYVHVGMGGFTESGALAALNSSGGDEDVGYSVLGMRAASVLQASDVQVTPHASFAWQHAFGDIDPVAALAFASTGIGFSVFGVPLARDSALVDAGLDVALGPSATLAVGYAGQLGSEVADHAVTGRLDWNF
ncbi:MAG: autotransporter outer membrane beta-barrel domain-containing protein, partial [Hyphomicrobium sp.]